jgi:ABC-2 type transport system ATP-binding protein
MSEARLAATDLTRRYGDLVAVDALSLSARPGEVLALLGPNGAGKTTTLDMLSGATRPDSGQVTWNDLPASPSRLRRLVGLCPQSIQVWPRLTCAEQLRLVARLSDVPARRHVGVVGELLERVGLNAQAKVQARRLSGGMQRRLNVALALVSEPAVVVLDEPEAGLDPQSRVLIRELIIDLARERIVIVSSHDLAEVERIADRVIILDHGRVIAHGTPVELLASAALTPTVEFMTGRDDAARLVGAFTELVGGDVRADGGRVVVRLGSGVSLDAALALAGRADVPLSAVRTSEASLEDLFLQLTGRSLRE